jgi:hypothetical protein
LGTDCEVQHREEDPQGLIPCLFIFDIDETLFHSYAKVWVRDSREHSEVTKKLSSPEFNLYKLEEPYESYDFEEFESSQIFYDTSEPIIDACRFAQLCQMISKMNAPTKITFLTARTDFDDPDLFKKKLTETGFDMGLIEVDCVGYAPKADVIRRYLSTGIYKACFFYEDSKRNLDAFIDLGKDFPDISLHPFFAENGYFSEYQQNF